MSFSLSNALERPPTRAAPGKHGCTLAWSLDLSPTETNLTPARSSTSSVSGSPELRAFAVVSCEYVALVPSHDSSHTRKAFRRERIARVYPMLLCLLCFHPCVGLNARARAVRAPARDVSSHTRVCFATCTHQFTIHFIPNKPYQTHVRRSTAHWFP